jgi:endo-1,4-beta-xylanase
MPGHYNHKYSSMDNVREAVRLFASTGARLAITELDFTWGNSEEPAVPLTPEQSAVQAAWYSELFALVLENEKHFDRITFWAKDDARSWRSWGSPMLFDTGGSAKEAYYAVIGAMK